MNNLPDGAEPSIDGSATFDPDNFSFSLFHSEKGLLRRYFSSPETDRILEEARRESRPEARAEDIGRQPRPAGTRLVAGEQLDVGQAPLALPRHEALGEAKAGVAQTNERAVVSAARDASAVTSSTPSSLLGRSRTWPTDALTR